MRVTRRQAYSALAGVGILIGTAGIASAATGNGSSTATPPAVTQQASTPDPTDADGDVEGNETTEANEAADTDRGTEDADDANDDAPTYTSSITIDDTTESANETDEQATLAGLATITADEASASALSATPGTVVHVELGNENGNVVYSVEIDTGNGVVDVKVDAGDATVLDAQADDDEGTHEDGDANEAPGTEEADD